MLTMKISTKLPSARLATSRFCCLLSACLVFALTGCEQKTEPTSIEVDQHIKALEAEISELKSNELNSQAFNYAVYRADTNFEQRVKGLEVAGEVWYSFETNYEQRIEALENLREQNWIMLDPTSEGFQRLDTTLGSLVVSVKSVTPYLDGYKVDISIGNPMDMDFNGFVLSCQWGLAPKIGANYDEIQKSQKSQDFQRTEVLLAGHWNPVELIIAPATTDEIKNLRISIKLNTIGLN